MFSRRIQQRARHLVALMIQPFARPGINPNTLTLVGLLLSILTAVVIAQGLLVAGGLLVLFAGMFDMLDGAMARVQNTATTFGAFLDSTLDRYSESIILAGLLYHVLQKPGLHDIVWPFPYEQSWMIGFIYIAVVGSLMVSYTKARAEGLGLECKNGLLARPERVILLAIGLLSGTYIWALAVLAVFSQVTAIERIVHVWLTTSRAAKIETQRASPEMLNTLPVAHSADTDNRQKLTILERAESIEPSVLPVHPGVPPFNRGVQHE
jgi:CDP-diacylglycerol---glycerol-3-phosphate 3-phosphatidyltransferase